MACQRHMKTVAVFMRAVCFAIAWRAMPRSMNMESVRDDRRAFARNARVLDLRTVWRLQVRVKRRPQMIVGDEQFATKEAIQQRAQEILRGDVREIDGQEAEFLLALFARHPRAGAKIGVGIAQIRAVRVMPFGTIGFEIERLDGTRTDISYRECLTPTGPAFWFSQACRREIVAQKLSARDHAFAGAVEIPCPVTGELFSREACEVDHEPPWTFAAILSAFITERSIDRTAVRYVRGDGVMENIFADRSLADDFASFHQARAALRVVSVNGHKELTRRRRRCA